MAPSVPQASIPRRYGSGTAIGGRRRGRGLLTDNINGVTKACIRKIARRGGVKRIEQSIYTTTKDVIETKLREIIARTVLYTTHNNRKTVTSLDVIWALQRTPGMGYGELKPVYGYEWPSTQRPTALKRTRNPNPNAIAKAWDEHIDTMIADALKAVEARKAANPTATTDTVAPNTQPIVQNTTSDRDGGFVHINDRVKTETSGEYDICDPDLDDIDLEEERAYARARIMAWAQQVAEESVDEIPSGSEQGSVKLSFRVGKPGISGSKK